MLKKLVLLLVTISVAGCVQTISTRNLDKKEGIPQVSYSAYFFSAGISERSRAVLLINADSGVEARADSTDITSTTASYAEALAFMREKKSARTVSTHLVSYKDKPVGYLLTYDQPGNNAETVNVTISEKNGVIYFNAREVTPTDD